MGIKDRAQKTAAGAMGIAVATSGLSSCSGVGAVDPLPPALQCDAVGDGQTLQAQASLVGTDTLMVRVQNVGINSWTVDSIGAVTGGVVQDILLPQSNSLNPAELTFNVVLNAGSTNAVFTVFAKTTSNMTTCDVVRQFSVTAAGVITSVVHPELHGLPLPARQRATITLVEQEGRIATLEVRSAFSGEKQVQWSVSDGELSAKANNRTTWELPNKRGIYQAEVVVDYGADGLAFDALPIEVL